MPTKSGLREHLAANAEVINIAAEQLADDLVGHSVFVYEIRLNSRSFQARKGKVSGKGKEPLRLSCISAWQSLLK